MKSAGATGVTLTATVATWEREPLAPVMVTVYEPGVVDDNPQFTLALEGGSVTLAGQVTFSPVEGTTVAVKVTVPANPLLPVTVTIVETPAWPEVKLNGLVAVMVKSAGVTATTWKVIEAVV